MTSYLVALSDFSSVRIQFHQVGQSALLGILIGRRQITYARQSMNGSATRAARIGIGVASSALTSSTSAELLLATTCSLRIAVSRPPPDVKHDRTCCGRKKRTLASWQPNWTHKKDKETKERNVWGRFVLSKS
jgi:hypothetical protein